MYNLLDIKWGEQTLGTPSGTINWQADLGGLTTTASLSGALQDAFRTWEGVASVDFASGGAIDLNIGYSSFSSDSIASNDGAAATASWLGSGEPRDAAITFNSDLPWAPTGSGGLNFFAVALHEIGHILGLDHVDDRSQIMNDVIFVDNLGLGDIEGVQELYGTDPGDAPIVFSGDGGGSVGSGGGDGGGGGGGAIGLLVGLIALIAGMFTGGAGAAVAMAAGRVATEDTDDTEADDFHLDAVWVPPLPMIEFEPTNIVDEPEAEDSFFL